MPQQSQEILQKWGDRPRRFHPRMEITGAGLVLGAGTLLAKMVRDELGAPLLSLDDKRRAMALLATAYDRPVGPYVITKISRACELWNEGQNAFAHIPLAHAGLPPCGEDEAQRLFIDEELLDNDDPPAARACRKIDDVPALLPFGDCFLVDPVALGEGSQALLTILCCSRIACVVAAHPCRTCPPPAIPSSKLAGTFGWLRP